MLPPLHYIIFPLFVAANAWEDAQWHASRIRLGNTSAAALGVAEKHLGWVGVEGEHWETVGKLLQEVSAANESNWQLILDQDSHTARIRY